MDSAALAFTAGEAAALIELRLGVRAFERDVRVLVEATHGWATALELAVLRARAEAAEGGSLLPVALDADLIGAPVREILGALAVEDRDALVQLAHLPFFSPELCDRLAGGAGCFERLVAVGAPVHRTDSGWWEMPGPVAEFLQALEPVTPASAATAASVYLVHGHELMAVRTLLAAGTPGEAARVLADVAPGRAEELGPAVMEELVEALGEPAVAAHPRVLLHVARVAEAAHDAGARSRALERVSRLVGRDEAGADRPLLREIDAERARDLLWDERTRPQARALAESVLAGAAADELVTRARALDVLGRLASWFSSEGPRPEAEELLGESARLSRRLGQRTWAAQALVPLAIGFYLGLCRFERALAVLEEALEELPARNRARAMVQSFRAEVLVEVGRYGEAEACIAEIREIGQWCREEWVLAYAAWNEANIASYQGDGDRVVRAVREVEQHRDVWFEQASGVEFLAQACDYLDRAGEHELAFAYLRLARQRMAGCERPVRVYGAAVLARSGDPIEAGRVIDDVLAEVAVEPHERWPLELLRAYAALRRGDPNAARLAADAFELCLDVGHLEGPLLRERAVALELLPLAAAAGSQVAAKLARAGGSVSIRLLGGFSVARAGRPLMLPPGKPAKAVRVVAAAGGRIHADQLTEILWPGSDAPAANNRLRNLLSRLRVAAGDLLIRVGEAIVLADTVEIDAQSFVTQADAAVAAPDATTAAAIARSALGRYRGELLPDDRYEDWAAVPREQLRLRQLELLDLLAASAQKRGEVDEAARMLQRAIEVERYDQQRYLALARLLVSQGREGTALAVLNSAGLALAELGLELSDAATELRAALDTHSRWAVHARD